MFSRGHNETPRLHPASPPDPPGPPDGDMMPFMTPEYTLLGPYIEVENEQGESYYIPELDGALEPGETATEHVGVLSRLSASGYLDCTDWSPAESYADARRDLSDTFDVDPVTGEDLPS